MTKIHAQNDKSLNAVLNAATDCHAKPLGDPQRIIVLLAPPGFDLPSLYHRALGQRGAVVVPAGPMNPYRVTFLKLLTHRTRVVPVLLASVLDWRRWNRSRPLAAAQIRRRTVMVIELGHNSCVNN